MGLVSISSCGDKNRKAGIRALNWAWEERTDNSWEREKKTNTALHIYNKPRKLFQDCSGDVLIFFFTSKDEREMMLEIYSH